MQLAMLILSVRLANASVDAFDSVWYAPRWYQQNPSVGMCLNLKPKSVRKCMILKESMLGSVRYLHF